FLRRENIIRSVPFEPAAYVGLPRAFAQGPRRNELSPTRDNADPGLGPPSQPEQSETEKERGEGRGRLQQRQQHRVPEQGMDVALDGRLQEPVAFLQR